MMKNRAMHVAPPRPKQAPTAARKTTAERDGGGAGSQRGVAYGSVVHAWLELLSKKYDFPNQASHEETPRLQIEFRIPLSGT